MRIIDCLQNFLGSHTLVGKAFMIVSIIFSISFLMGSQNTTVPKVAIQDSEVLKLLEQYEKHITKEGFDNPHKQHLLLRIERDEKKQFVYLGCTSLISFFVDDVPNSYAEYNGRMVYIYSGEGSHNRGKFREFYDQFEKALGNDITRDIQQNPYFQYGFIHHPETWRAEFLAKRLKRIKQIPQFPSYKFYEDYRYNDDGQVIYKDGIYHESSIDPHQWEPDNFDLRVYILQNTSIPEHLLRNEMVNAVLVIDEKGKVTEANIEGLTDEKMIDEVQQALRKMPAWHPGKIEGKPVKVRLRQRL